MSRFIALARGIGEGVWHAMTGRLIYETIERVDIGVTAVDAAARAREAAGPGCLLALRRGAAARPGEVQVGPLVCLRPEDDTPAGWMELVRGLADGGNSEWQRDPECPVTAREVNEQLLLAMLRDSSNRTEGEEADTAKTKLARYGIWQGNRVVVDLDPDGNLTCEVRIRNVAAYWRLDLSTGESELVPG